MDTFLETVLTWLDRLYTLAETIVWEQPIP